MGNNKRITREKLTAQIQRGWTQLQETVDRLDETQLNDPDPESGWAVKDHLMHLATWEGGIAALLRKKSRAGGMGLTESEWRELKTDALNDLVFERNRHRSLADIRAYYSRVHEDLLAALDDLSDEDLYRSYTYFQPDEGGRPKTAPIINRIIGNTYGHYNEHIRYFAGRFEASDE
ncbi:MAG: DinB family protein [Chloroflexota bacterium]|jgi:hypothetical protein